VSDTKKQTRARMGRPPLAEGTARTQVFSIKLSAEERAAIEAAAERAGQQVTRWARDALVSAAVGALPSK